jgi:hypothetical protein
MTNTLCYGDNLGILVAETELCLWARPRPGGYAVLVERFAGGSQQATQTGAHE